MNANIFENAKFGDKFRTRDGRMAILIEKGADIYCIVKNEGLYPKNIYPYNIDGKVFGVYGHSSCHPYDIIGKWEDCQLDVNNHVIDKLKIFVPNWLTDRVGSTISMSDVFDLGTFIENVVIESRTDYINAKEQ